MRKPFKLPTVECLRCGHTWTPHKPIEPKFCPKCKSAYWNEPIPSKLPKK